MGSDVVNLAWARPFLLIVRARLRGRSRYFIGCVGYKPRSGSISIGCVDHKLAVRPECMTRSWPCRGRCVGQIEGETATNVAGEPRFALWGRIPSVKKALGGPARPPDFRVGRAQRGPPRKSERSEPGRTPTAPPMGFEPTTNSTKRNNATTCITAF